MPIPVPLDALRLLADRIADRSHVPFSGAPTGAVLLLDDGAWVPGVRVESASFSLTIPALLNAHTTAVALGRGADVLAVVLSRPMRPEETPYLEALPHGPFESVAGDAWIHSRLHDAAAASPSDAAPRSSRDGSAPGVDDVVSPFLPDAVGPSPDDGIERVRQIARRAHVPASDFPVGSLLVFEDGRCLPGVNVEHPDWARILCAERNAVGTAQSYGLTGARRLFLTCLRDREGTPCGACRQLLAELTPDATLWMDRHESPPAQTTLPELLPGSFRGRALLS